MSALPYASERSHTRWSKAYRAIVAADPRAVTDNQLRELYGAIRAELWPAGETEVEWVENPLLYVVRFCKGIPAIVNIMGDLGGRLKDRYTWDAHARLIQEALQSAAT
jgi:hypothetical protein